MRGEVASPNDTVSDFGWAGPLATRSSLGRGLRGFATSSETPSSTGTIGTKAASFSVPCFSGFCAMGNILAPSTRPRQAH